MTKTTFTLLLAVLCATPSSAQPKAPLLSMIACNVADLVTTQQAFARSPQVHEANTIYGGRSMWAIGTAKMSFTMGVGLIMYALDKGKHPRVAAVFGYTDTAATCAAAWHNRKVGR